MWNDVLDLAARLRAEGEPFVLATVVARGRPQSVPLGARAVVRADGSVTGWVGGGCVRPAVVDEALHALADGRPRLVRVGVPPEADPPPGEAIYPMTCHGGGRVEVYVEPVHARPTLLVFGVTPVARALTELARPLGFDVVVADPHARADAFPGAHRVETDLDAAAGLVAPDAFVVVATQGEGDEPALEAALAAPSRYVGLVASRKKGAAVLAFLEGRGVPADALAAVRYPAGLDLGGMDPAEIALSILAEVVAVRAGSAAGERAAAVPEAGVGDRTTPASATGFATARAASPPLVGLGAAPDRFATDPVCGMKVEVARARFESVHDGQPVYFCCPVCQATFDKDPSAYVAAGAE